MINGSNGVISLLEYKRRVFNSVLCECFSLIHAKCLGINENETLFGGTDTPDYIVEMADTMSKEFFASELKLDESNIFATKKALSGANTFIQQCVVLAEAIANDKVEAVKKSGTSPKDDGLKRPKLNKEEKTLVKKMFDSNEPQTEADAVRKSTVDALLAERKKAEKVKEATSIAQKAGDSKKLEETVNRINARGATSLMHAILTTVSEAAIKDVLSQNPDARLSSILSENADEINSRACMMYTLYEAFNAFGIKKYSKQDIKRIADEIYSGN